MSIDIVGIIQTAVVQAITDNIAPILLLGSVAFIAANIGTIMNYIRHNFVDPPPKLDEFEPPELSNEAWHFGTAAISSHVDDSQVCCSEKDATLIDWDNSAFNDRSELPELHDDLTAPEGGDLIETDRGGFSGQSDDFDFDEIKEYLEEHQEERI